MRTLPVLTGAAIIVLAAFLTNLFWRSSPTTASDGESSRPRLISVSGQGESYGTPDQATISAGVVSEATTAQAALAQNSTAMAQVIDGLKKLGVEEKHIQTSNFSVSPKYPPYVPGQPEQARRIIGYEVSNTVTIMVKDLAKMGPMLDQIIQLGANSIGGINFSISDTKTLMKQAREAAVADAKMRAETYAAAAGVKVGKVIQISEQSAVVPVPVAFRMAADAAPPAAPPPPIAAGQQEINTTVSIVFAIE